MRYAGSIILVMLALAALASTARTLKHPRFPEAAEAMLAPFAADAPASTAYEDLFRYFLTGFLAYQDPLGASASYPGLRSNHGRRIDAMEGFTRLTPLVAAWLHSGRSATVESPHRPHNKRANYGAGHLLLGASIL